MNMKWMRVQMWERAKSHTLHIILMTIYHSTLGCPYLPFPSVPHLSGQTKTFCILWCHPTSSSSDIPSVYFQLSLITRPRSCKHSP